MLFACSSARRHEPNPYGAVLGMPRMSQSQSTWGTESPSLAEPCVALMEHIKEAASAASTHLGHRCGGYRCERQTAIFKWKAIVGVCQHVCSARPCSSDKLVPSFDAYGQSSRGLPALLGWAHAAERHAHGMTATSL